MGKSVATNRVIVLDESVVTDLGQFIFPSGDIEQDKTQPGAITWDANGDLWTKGSSSTGWLPHDEVKALIIETDTYPSARFATNQFLGQVKYSNGIPYTKYSSPAGDDGTSVTWARALQIPAETGVYFVNASFTYAANTYPTSTPLVLDLDVAATGSVDATGLQANQETVSPIDNTKPVTLACSALYVNNAATARNIDITLGTTPTDNNCRVRVSVIKLSDIDSNAVANLT